MKLTAVLCVYNEEEYLEYAVRSIAPAVDEVILCLGMAPYTAYNPRAREISRADRTESIVDALSREIPKLSVVKGLWSSEVEHRNAGLELCLERGSDYYWLVDGDEVYREDHLTNIREELIRRPDVGTFIVKCHIFWRSFSYRIPAGELTWRPRRIFKITRFRKFLGLRFRHTCRFVGQNEMNSMGPIYEFPPDRAIFYHFSYARSTKAMEDKFRTFSHAHEIGPEWLSRVWQRWPQERQMRDIHPIDPPKFPRALRQDPEDLPLLMRNHPFYGMDLIP